MLAGWFRGRRSRPNARKDCDCGPSLTVVGAQEFVAVRTVVLLQQAAVRAVDARRTWPAAEEAEQESHNVRLGGRTGLDVGGDRGAAVRAGHRLGVGSELGGVHDYYTWSTRWRRLWRAIRVRRRWHESRGRGSLLVHSQLNLLHLG
jgi:hypothetical protein